MTEKQDQEWYISLHEIRKIFQIIGTEEVFLMLEINGPERDIVSMKWMKGMTNAEIARQLQLSRERIRQIYDSAILKIKSRLTYAILKYKELKWLLEENQKLKIENESLRNQLGIPDDRQESRIINEDTLKININELADLSVRCKKIFNAHNIITVGDLIQYSLEDLRKFRNIGEQSISSVKEVLRDYNLLCSEKSKYSTQDLWDSQEQKQQR